MLRADAQRVSRAEAAGCDVLAVSRAVMEALSEAKTPQGILCTAAIPQRTQALTGDLIVALDGVQDPGNVGTILRTADAAGFDGALLGMAVPTCMAPRHCGRRWDPCSACLCAGRMTWRASWSACAHRAMPWWPRSWAVRIFTPTVREAMPCWSSAARATA